MVVFWVWQATMLDFLLINSSSLDSQVAFMIVSTSQYISIKACYSNLFRHMKRPSLLIREVLLYGGEAIKINDNKNNLGFLVFNLAKPKIISFSLTRF
jgi:hypothetical protein